HGLRHGRMWEHGFHQLDLGSFERLGDAVTLDHLGHFGPDHVRAQEFAGLRVEHHLHHAFALADRGRLAVADEGEAADLHLVALPLRHRFGVADRGDLWMAVGAAWDARGVERMDVVQPGDLLDTDDAFMARLVREPRRPRDVPYGIDAGLARAAPLVD